MGGPGSGNWGRFSTKFSTKKLVEDCCSLDVNRLHREGFLRPELCLSCTWKDGWGNVKASIEIRTLPGAIELSSRIPFGGQPRDIRYQVPLTYTPCNWGGERPWFVCPGKGCGRRVGKLYLGGKYFLCRHCYDLAYKSQKNRQKWKYIPVG